MPDKKKLYRFEIYETWTSKVEIEASNIVEALESFSEGDWLPSETTFIETDTSRGRCILDMAESDQDALDELLENGYTVTHRFPSIRNIEVEDNL